MPKKTTDEVEWVDNDETPSSGKKALLFWEPDVTEMLR